MVAGYWRLSTSLRRSFLFLKYEWIMVLLYFAGFTLCMVTSIRPFLGFERSNFLAYITSKREPLHIQVALAILGRATEHIIRLLPSLADPRLACPTYPTKTLLLDISFYNVVQVMFECLLVSFGCFLIWQRAFSQIYFAIYMLSFEPWLLCMSA